MKNKNYHPGLWARQRTRNAFGIMKRKYKILMVKKSLYLQFLQEIREVAKEDKKIFKLKKTKEFHALNIMQ